MKMINKSELEYKDGYVLNGNDIVALDPRIVRQANSLEEMVQKRRWLNDQPSACAGPNLSSFERESEFDALPHWEAETPLIDKKIEDSMKFMKELDEVNLVDMVNEKIFNYLKELVEFSTKDYVIDESGLCSPERFDLPTLGNPLELTADQISKYVAEAYGLDVSDE